VLLGGRQWLSRSNIVSKWMNVFVPQRRRVSEKIMVIEQKNAFHHPPRFRPRGAEHSLDI
jgi:hypothetical protein